MRDRRRVLLVMFVFVSAFFVRSLFQPEPVSPTRVEALDYFLKRVFPEIDGPHDLFADPEISVDLTLRLVTTNPRPIYMLHTRNTQNQLAFQKSRVTETLIRRTVRRVLSDLTRGCGSGRLVVDVGANEGTYTLLAAAYGCRVVAFEPQPDCAAQLSFGVAINDFLFTPKIINRVATSLDTEFTVPKSVKCHGMQTFIPATHEVNDPTVDVVKGTSVDEVVSGARVPLIHMDVEGAEILVLRSAAASIASGNVMNVIVEINPSRWANYGVSIDDGFDTLNRIFRAYTCRKFHENVASHETDPIDAPVLKDFRVSENEVDVWCTLETYAKSTTNDAPIKPMKLRPGW